MNAFWEFVRKEIFHILREYRTLLVLFGMPIAQVILFGFAIRTEINDASIGIYDRSKDYVTREIINKLLSTGYYQIEEYSNDFFDIEQAFKEGKIDQMIVFEPNFAEKLYKYGNAEVQLINDGSNPNAAKLLSAYTTSILLDYQNNLTQSTIQAKILVNPEVRMLFNPEMKSVYMFVPGLIAFILLLVCALLTSIAITREKELGNMEILLVSPLRPSTIIIGKVLPYIILSFINAISILILAVWIFELPIVGSLWLLLGEIVLFIITSLSLGILISTIANTQQVAMMVSLAGLMMPTILLSGFIFPIEEMPTFLQIISYIIPARWFLIIAKGIMLKGLGISHLWLETLILIGMTTVLIILSIKNFKIRLD